MKIRRQVKRNVGQKCEVTTRYGVLSGERSPYLDRGREFSRLSLPQILPEDGASGSSHSNQHGYQAITAQATNHLSNKMVTTMFPPHVSFFRSEFTEDMKAKLISEGWDESKLTEALVGIEKKAGVEQQKTALRVALTNLYKQIIISGNSLLEMHKGKKAKAIPLSNYALRLDNEGEVTELAIEESVCFEDLPEDAQNILQGNVGKVYNDKTEKLIYMKYMLKEKKTYVICHTIDDIIVKKHQIIPISESPWKPIFWNRLYNEHYGRGHIEDNVGDVYVIELLSEAVVKGMVLMSDIKYIIKQGSIIDEFDFATSETGAILRGAIDDISVLQLEKYMDFTPIREVINEYRRRIGQAFLLDSAVRRDAERVTTYELKMDATELELTLGGVYSLLADSLQNFVAHRLIKEANIPKTVYSSLDVRVVTGLEALGRTGDLDKIHQYSQMMELPNGWPEEVRFETNFTKYGQAVRSALSMDSEFQYSDDELKQKRQAQQEQAEQEQLASMAEKAVPTMIKGEG